MTRVAILGAGPAGLGAAWQLQRQGKAQAIVLEQHAAVGGNAGSFDLDGLPVDYGSHRLHPSCRPDILADLRTLLGADLLDRPRHGRIRLRGRWIHFPLQPLDLLLHMPWSFALGVGADAVHNLGTRREPVTETSFASELERGLGATICRDFYFPYARKIWGLAPGELSATQARRRVSAGSLPKMLRRVLAVVPGIRAGGAGRFFYPRHGYGQISRVLAAAAQSAGADIQLQTKVRGLQLGTPHLVEAECAGVVRSIQAEHIWSTIPITALAQRVSPAAPTEVLQAAKQISYRAMVLVYLVVAQPRFTPYDAHYFPEHDVSLTRLSEPKNYTGRTDPPGRTVLCAELPCAVDDPIWRSSDAALAAVVRDALARCNLPIRAAVLKVTTRRLPAAYPIYRRGYEAPFQRLDNWIAGLDRVLTFGRQGLFAHDNTHHALAMAYSAVDCLSSAGDFDWERWRRYRTAFESHVVED
jgi:protoporphyrinogen oxidase